MALPGIYPRSGLEAVAPGGRLTVFCICGLDRSQGVSGQIEPPGVRAEWRSLCLGRALLSEDLRWLVLRSARRIYVETDNYRNTALKLYESCEFRAVRDVLV